MEPPGIMLATVVAHKYATVEIAVEARILYVTEKL
jgi:hypothetical protein